MLFFLRADAYRPSGGHEDTTSLDSQGPAHKVLSVGSSFKRDHNQDSDLSSWNLTRNVVGYSKVYSQEKSRNQRMIELWVQSGYCQGIWKRGTRVNRKGNSRL